MREDAHMLRCSSVVPPAQVHYRSLGFYLEEHPDLLVDLLNVLTTRLDHARVVHQFRKANHLPLIKDYLVGVQKSNIAEVRAARWQGGGGCVHECMCARAGAHARVGACECGVCRVLACAPPCRCVYTGRR